MLLSIIIVSYNTRDLTLQTLESVWKDIAASSILKNQTEIIVVDNNSSDDSVEKLKKWSKTKRSSERDVLDIKILEKASNAGFAKANNHAIDLSHGEYVLLLNSDTIVQPGALTTMVKTFQAHPLDETTAQLETFKNHIDRLGILVSLLLNPDKTIQPQGGSFPTLFSLACHMLMLDDIPIIGQFLPSTQHTGRRAVRLNQHELVQQDWVGGTAMMLRRELIEEIGGLDPNIFMYGEDVELCLRARHHHWDVAIQPAAQIIHFGMASSSSANAIKGELKGYLYIWSKHKPLWQFNLVRWLLKTGMYLRWLLFGTMRYSKGYTEKAQLYKSLATEL